MGFPGARGPIPTQSDRRIDRATGPSRDLAVRSSLRFTSRSLIPLFVQPGAKPLQRDRRRRIAERVLPSHRLRPKTRSDPGYGRPAP